MRIDLVLGELSSNRDFAQFRVIDGKFFGGKPIDQWEPAELTRRLDGLVKNGQLQELRFGLGEKTIKLVDLGDTREFVAKIGEERMAILRPFIELAKLIKSV